MHICDPSRYHRCRWHRIDPPLAASCVQHEPALMEPCVARQSRADTPPGVAGTPLVWGLPYCRLREAPDRVLTRRCLAMATVHCVTLHCTGRDGNRTVACSSLNSAAALVPNNLMRVGSRHKCYVVRAVARYCTYERKARESVHVKLHLLNILSILQRCSWYRYVRSELAPTCSH